MKSQRLACLVGLVIGLGGCGQSPDTAKDGGGGTHPKSRAKPNILLYMIDTLRADALACYGNDIVRTPAFDRLADEGTLFENAIAPTSWTRPSIASILTSASPGAHGAQQREDALARQLALISETLKEHGYATCCITTNPNIGSFFGFSQGFDEFIELYARRDPGFIRVLELTTTCDVVTEHAIDWLETAPKPFCLITLTIDPHSPYTPPPAFDTYGGDYDGRMDGTGRTLRLPNLSDADKQRVRSLYYGEVSFNDSEFGKLYDHLHDTGLLDQTIVVMTSDHGEEFWEHGNRGHGKALFEESIHVPLIMRYPPAVAAGQRVRRAVSLLDIYPTILGLADISIPDWLEGDQLLATDTDAEPALLATLEHDGRSLVALRQYPWKLIQDRKTGEKLLFNLAQSPGERQNVLADHQSHAARLEELTTRLVEEETERFTRLHQGGGPSRVPSSALSDDARRALEALGYIGGDDEEEDEAGAADARTPDDPNDPNHADE